MTKHISAALAAALVCLTVSVSAQTPKKVNYTYTEASDLTLVGKIFTDTPNPYHRVDTVKYKGFTKSENQQVRESSGIAVVFKTNSTTISVKTDYAFIYKSLNTGDYSGKGYDLYIKKDGEWLWAAAGCAPLGKEQDYNYVLIKDMDNSEKECLLYLPLFSEENSVKIGVQEGATIEAGEEPFRHRVAIFGSSYTQGTCTMRSGMSYPAQFTRATGIQLLSLGCAGNCKMQPYFANALAHAENVEAFIFDSFSNPEAPMIKDRLFTFIETLQAAHPGIPLIFQKTIYREYRNFNLQKEDQEQAKMDMSDSLMKIACKKYDHVYYVVTNATDEVHDSSVDGVHPGDHGYTLWAESIRKPILKILKKYGIK